MTTQKIVILPGPHKTGSTTVQSALYDWLTTTKSTTNLNNNQNINKTTTTSTTSSYNNNNNNNNNPFKDWEWPLPPDYHHDGGSNNVVVDGGKSFSYLARALAGYPNGRNDIKSLLEAEQRSRNNHQPINNDKYIQKYQMSFQKAFDSNKNIVIAAEFLDIIASHKHMRSTSNTPDNTESQSLLNITVGIELLDRLYNILPKTISKSKKSSSTSTTRMRREIIVVITYRYPRVDHLISLWHEFGKHTTLSDFILNKQYFTKKSYILNSMELVTKFLYYFIMNNNNNRRRHNNSSSIQKQQDQQDHEHNEEEDNNNNNNNRDDDDIYKVILIDTEGILNVNADLPTVIACHVLDVPCIWKKKKIFNDNNNNNNNTTTMMIPVCIDNELDDDDDGCRQIDDNADTDNDDNNNNNSVNNDDITTTTTTFTTMKNKRSDTGPRNLTPEMIQNIDQLLNNYDCQYKLIFDNIMKKNNNYDDDDDDENNNIKKSNNNDHNNHNHLQFLYQHHMLNNCYDDDDNNNEDDDDRLKKLLSPPPPEDDGSSVIVKRPFSDVVRAIRNLVATNSTT